MRQPDWKRHEVRSVIAGVPEHHSLVTSTLAIDDVFAALATALFFTDVNTLCDVRALRVKSNNNTTGVSIETVCSIVVTDALDCSTSDGRNVYVSVCCDFTRHDTKTSSQQCLACNTTVRVNGQQRIKY